VSITNDKGERIHTRQTGDPEPFHLEIYRALGLSAKPLTQVYQVNDGKRG